MEATSTGSGMPFRAKVRLPTSRKLCLASWRLETEMRTSDSVASAEMRAAWFHTGADVVEARAVGFGPMQADANPRGEALTSTVVRELALDGQRAFERQVDVIESEEEAVPGRLDLLTTVLGDQGSQRLVVPSQHAGPRLVAKGAGELGRVHDVGEGEGLHRAASGCGWPRTATPSERREQRLGPADVRHGSEVLECSAGCLRFHRGPLGIAGSLCLCHQHSGARDLVRSLDLGPQSNPVAQLPSRARRIAIGQQDGAPCCGGCGQSGRGAEAIGQPGELVRRGPGGFEVLGRERDLHPGGQQPDPVQVAVRRGTPGGDASGLVERLLNRGLCRGDLALCKPEQ